MDQRESIAHIIAQMHYRTQAGLTQVFSLRSPTDTDASPVRLLEVVEDTVAAGIIPLGFRLIPALGITLPSVIVEVTPEEYQQIRDNKLTLPHEWTIGEEIPLQTV